MDDYLIHQARQFGSMEGYGPLAQLIEVMRKRWERKPRSQR
jgi:hypothetical protein